MSEKNPSRMRRNLVKATGAGLALGPLLGLSGCSDDKAASDTSAAKAMEEKASAAADAAKDTAADMAESAGDAMADAKDAAGDAMADAKDAAGDAMEDAKDAAGDAMADAKEAAGDAVDSAKEAVVGDGKLPKVEESDALAKSLGYKHSADDVDASKYPQRTAGALCSNCVLYQGGDAQWGACSIFVGKLVNADGWCATYAPKG